MATIKRAVPITLLAWL